MHWKTAIITCLGFAALSANAQVHRCKDASGKTVYSDQPCATGQAGALIERQRSQAEIRREREQAYNAELQKQERRIAEQERTLSQQQRAAQQLPAQVLPTQQTEGWQERKDRENARTSATSTTNNGGRFDASAEAARKEEARRRAAAAPATITHCDPGFCYDDRGAVYHKAGPDFMTGPNGQACYRAGTAWNCN